MVVAPLASKVLRPIWRTRYPTTRVLQERIEFVLDWSTANHFDEGRNSARLKGHLDNPAYRGPQRDQRDYSWPRLILNLFEIS